jgi:hypothetical protein
VRNQQVQVISLWGVTEWQVEHQADADRLQTGRDSTELRQTKVNNVPSTRLVDVKSEKVL